MGRRFKSAGIPPDGLLVADGDRLRLPRNLGRLRTLIKDIGAGLIVLDSLRRLAPGVRENESDDMAVVIAELGTLARDLDVAIVLIHHRSTKHGGATLRGSSRSRIRPVYLERHAASVRPRTITTLRDRLRHAIRAFGDVRLHELEHMTDEIAAWQARLPPRAGHGIAQALRQVLGAAVRWQHIDRNPAILAGRNPKPPPRAVRAFTTEEIAAIAAELSVRYQPLPAFAAATGLRPEEWQALERRDVHRHAGILVVRRTVSSGVVVELTKTTGSRREVPLTGAARAALDAVAPRLDTGLLLGARGRGLRHPHSGSHLRPAEYLRLACARRGRPGLRAGEGDGDVDRDDRAARRDAARRIRRRLRRAHGRLRERHRVTAHLSWDRSRRRPDGPRAAGASAGL